MTTTAEKDLLSIGRLAADTQKPVRRIEQAAAELGISPDLKLNGVPYFSGAQVERLTAKLKEQK